MIFSTTPHYFMFSLIITIASIALVVALVAATLFHGGDVLTKGQDAAAAAEIITQGQQVLAAAVFYNSEHGQWPANEQELLDGGYLKSLPTFTAEKPKFELISSAYAEDTSKTWTMPFERVPLFKLMVSVPEGVCREVNQQTRGDAGILKKASNQVTAQCFGDTTNNLTVIVTLNKNTVENVLPTDKVLVGSLAPVISNPSSSEWLVTPEQGKTAAPDTAFGVVKGSQFDPDGSTTYKNWQGVTLAYPSEYLSVSDTRYRDGVVVSYAPRIQGGTFMLDEAKTEGFDESKVQFGTATFTLSGTAVAPGKFLVRRTGYNDWNTYATIDADSDAALIAHAEANAFYDSGFSSSNITRWEVYRYTNGGINYVEVTGYGTDPFSGDPDASMAYYNTPVYSGTPPARTFTVSLDSGSSMSDGVFDVSLIAQDGFYFLYTSASISITYQYDGGDVKTVTKTLPIVIKDEVMLM